MANNGAMNCFPGSGAPMTGFNLSSSNQSGYSPQSSFVPQGQSSLLGDSANRGFQQQQQQQQQQCPNQGNPVPEEASQCKMELMALTRDTINTIRMLKIMLKQEMSLLRSMKLP